MITADLHDGEHDDVEGGVGAVEHLPLHAGVQGAHLLVDVLKRKNDILKDGKIVYKNICAASYEEDFTGFGVTKTPFYLKNSLRMKKTCRLQC